MRIFYEVYGDGDPTVLLLPTWSIIHSRHWKAQIPYLARHFRVVTFDGRGNGKSDRPPGVAAVPRGTSSRPTRSPCMDATEHRARRARGAVVRARTGCTLLAADHPERVSGGRSTSARPSRSRPGTRSGRSPRRFEEELDTDEGWAKYNRHYWQRDYRGLPRVLLRADVPRAALDEADRGLHRLGARDRPGDAGRHDVGDGPLRARGVPDDRARACGARCSSSTATAT